MPYLLALWFLMISSLSWAEVAIVDESCSNKYSAKVVSLQGGFLVDPDREGNWHQLRLNELICEGSGIKVEANSRASIRLVNGVVLRLHEGTNATLDAISTDKSTFIHLFKGFIHFISRTPRLMKISTPIANGGPEGTEFAMRVDDNKASLWVYEGGVKFYNDKGSVFLKPGEGGQTLKDQAPQAKIDIKPKDAVNWALYYPPVLPYPDKNTVIDSELRTAINDYRQGHIDTALARLDGLATSQQNPYFYQVRAAMRLTVGQDQLALQDIQSLLNKNPQDTDALALHAVLALTQNHKDESYALATQAIAANPQSASAYSALSYAEQSRFQLDKAQVAANKATELAPNDAMVWARKAELQLSQGLTAESQQAAEKAIALDANLERTQTVLGFSYLLRMDTDGALETFKKAIQLDSTSPLARLGLGLAKIRSGELEEGRQDLETAAILDPNNSIVRSYLGKAYYEERRRPLAEDQFNLAKDRDPKDPTPYFYDAINKQTSNRPVEALQDMQKAIELNDNRAVYRSSLALDNDLAIRNTSLARIYDDLGFDSRATVEATKSLTIDPTNYSAHRFLSDAYVRLPRREISQVSELLQSQLMQPLNSNPVQPHLSVKGLSTVSGLGPVEPSFKDFTSSFERNRPYFTTSGVVGSNNTYGDEAVISGIQDRFSYSLGQYHLSTDGFRKDANVIHDIYNAFLQTAISPDISLQFEFRKRLTDQGDVRMVLSDQPHIATEKRHLDQTTGRAGIKVSLTPKDLLLGSFIYSDRKENLNTFEDPSSQEFGGKTIDYRKGFEGELQYLHNSEIIDTVFGAGTYIVDLKTNTKIKIPPILLDGFDQGTCSLIPNTRFITGKCYLFDLDQNNDFSNTSESYSFYIYNNLNFPNNLKWTLGLSYEQFKGVNDENESAFHRRIYPKLGVQWFIKDWLRLRGVYLKTLKRQLIADQTIEPTQVAGFNQFYDDLNGTQTTLKGIGLDANFGKRAFSGVELTERNINSNNNALEQQVRAYFNFTLSSTWVFSIENQFERYLTTNQVLETDILPITLKYFHDSGLFAQFAPTLVWQNKKSGINLTDHISSNFPLFNLSIGYRLPKRLGIISLEVQNIADKHFIFDDSYYRTSDQFNIVHPFLPTRTIMFRAILNF